MNVSFKIIFNIQQRQNEPQLYSHAIAQSIINCFTTRVLLWLATQDVAQA